MSRARASKNHPPFATYEEAIRDLYSRLDGYYLFRNVAFYSLGSSKEELVELEKSHAREMLFWFERTCDLPRPWPAQFQLDIFNPEKFLDPTAQSVSVASNENTVSGKKLVPRAHPLQWLEIEDLPLRRKLTRILVKDIGVPAHMYLPELKATMLGRAAYRYNTVALKIILPHCPPPQSRLVTERHHLSPTAPLDLVGSTLLHRIVQMVSGLDENKTQHQDSIGKIKACLEMLIKHDPENLLVRTYDTHHLPHEMDPQGAIGRWVEQQHDFLVAKQTKGKLLSVAGYKRSPSKSLSKPKM